MGEPRPQPLIFDAGALIGLERRIPRVLHLITAAKAAGRLIVIPATVLAQVWKGGRDRQAPLALPLRRKELGLIQVVPMTEAVAQGAA